MSENILLLRHAGRWAETKNRPLDGDLLETVVDLRQHHDHLPATSWPAGSVEALLLERWPAHGPLDLPDLVTLRDTLDTYWRFLRATGRMSSGSAAPADLVKEARRVLPKMADACSDRARFSTGRVLQDFGRSIGISLDDPASGVDEINARLQRITEAWNELPTEERKRLLPDPSPKSAAAQAMTEAVNAVLGQADVADDEDDEDESVRRGDPAVAAVQVRESAYLRSCFALAEWVGDGREVTATGVLRPAVARQAYLDLDLTTWEREWRRRDGQLVSIEEESAEVAALLDKLGLDYWRTAGDCLPLDRLWYACDAAELVDIGSRRATRRERRLESDLDWLMCGATLVFALMQRCTSHRSEVVRALLFHLLLAEDGTVDIRGFRRWWHTRSAFGATPQTPELVRLVTNLQNERLDWALQMFADTALWVRDGDRLTITDFGREFTVVVGKAVEAGYFDDDDFDR